MIPGLLLLIPALASIESGLNSKAVSQDGKALGYLQIRQGVVEDCNRINKHIHFVHSDALDIADSRAMFLIYVGHYATAARLGYEPSLRDAALIWHYGPDGWRMPSTDDYWQRAERLMR